MKPTPKWEYDRWEPVSSELRHPISPSDIKLHANPHSLGRSGLVLVGAGRGAAELARQLIAAGVRRLTIIDRDAIGPENLDAMPHAAPADIGQPKALVLGRALQRNQPELSVSCLAESITEAAALQFLDQTRADTVFSFVDNDAARLTTSVKCRQGAMVHVDVGTLIRHDDAGHRTMQADIRLFEPGRGCIACVPRLPRFDDALYELSAPTGSLRRGQPVEPAVLRTATRNRSR